MQKITININPSIFYEHIMFFLKNLPKNLVHIEEPKKVPPLAQLSKKAFGILKGKIKDPVAWQREIREESDRDKYNLEVV